jgi:hypothetical protein
LLDRFAVFSLWIVYGKEQAALNLFLRQLVIFGLCIWQLQWSTTRQPGGLSVQAVRRWPWGIPYTGIWLRVVW